MPLPFILAGAAIVAGIYGVKKSFDAKSDFDAAESINEDAQEIFDAEKRALERRKEEAQSNLESLGRQKVQLYDEALIPFVETFKQIKNVDSEELKVRFDSLELHDGGILEISEATTRMGEVIGGTAGTLGSGALAGLAAYGSVGALASASTGTAIAGLSGAAATNATLAWLGGGSLAAGGLGMAGGAAVLGGIVAAPVLLVGGLMMASKAEEAKENARSNRLKAQAAAEEMETAGVAALAIGHKANEIRKVLRRLQENYLDGDLSDLQDLVSTNADYRTYSDPQKKLVGRTVSLAVTTMNLAEAPLLEEDGSITKAIRETLRQSRKLLQTLDEM